MNKGRLLFFLGLVLLLLAGAGWAQSVIVMNEIYSRGTTDSPDWVEIYNSSAAPVDISGFKIYDSGGYAGTKAKKEFPAGTLVPAGGVVVVVTDNTGDPSAFGLSSGGEAIWLENASGAVIDTVAFPAMQTTETYARIPDGGLWKLQGRMTRGTLNTIKMNEIYSRGVVDNPDWIELYNDSEAPVDLSGYKIFDSGGQGGTKPKMAVPAGTMIDAKGFFVIVTDVSGDASGFGLSSGGEKVWLQDSTGAYCDSVAFLAMQTTESYSRVPDGGPWILASTITRGVTNGTASGVEQQAVAVADFQLRQNYPNPFNPSTRIEFSLPHAADVQVAVYGLNGQMVAELVNGRLAAGSHQLTFNAANLASGVYIYTIRSADLSAARRMVLMK